ncbi:RidA family protein [Elioraea rosea]|uniref:RidA family protein n=1 Tax=Elioraea rosea TaxID=2492390 RepID=UPI001315AA65|nr:RidA family protein [Elioraea rosea]
MPTITFANPAGMPKPAARYSMTAEVVGEARWVLISGQLPIAEDGSVPEDFASQAELVARHIEAALAHHEFGWGNVVKLTTYLTTRAARGAWQAKRDALFPGTPPASTQVIVAGLADPRCAIEVEAIAVG